MIPPYRPQLATLARVPPGDDAAWLFELKWDGWRGGLIKTPAGRVRLESRHNNDLTARFPTLTDALKELPVDSALFDGEIAVLLPSGLTSFEALQQRRVAPAAGRLVMFLFDVHFLNGQDLRRQPLEARKAKLERCLAHVGSDSALRYTPHFVGDGARVLEHACALGAEGIVCKRLTAPHTPGRSRDWLKCKCVRTKPFVVGGFTYSGRSRVAVSALLVGRYDAQGMLRYAGDVGTGKGFTRAFLQELYTQLRKLESPRSPFAGYEPSAVRSPWSKGAALPVRWVMPLAVVDVDHLELTTSGRLRHASFRQFRADLAAQDVRREEPDDE